MFRISLSILFFCIITTSQLVAFSFSPDSKDKNTPIEIVSQKGMVFSKDKKRCTALGSVVSTKGSSVLKSQKLVVYFKDTKGQKNMTSRSSSQQNIKKIKASGNVHFYDSRGGFQATANNALYQAQKGELLLQGNPILKNSETTVFIEKSIIFYEKSLVAVTQGRSTIKRGNKLMQADVLRVYFKKDKNNKLIFERIQADGNVIISTPTEIAKSNRGVYYSTTRIAELFDDVVLTTSQGQLRGNYGHYDMLTGQSRIVYKQKDNVPKKRAQGILTSNSNQNKKTDKKKKK